MYDWYRIKSARINQPCLVNYYDKCLLTIKPFNVVQNVHIINLNKWKECRLVYLDIFAL